VKPEGDQRLFQSPQEVLQDSTDHMDILDFTEYQSRLPLEEAISELLHWTLAARNSV